MAAEFTPVESTVGGLLIGLSAASALLVHGRVAGVSGIFNTLRCSKDTKELLWSSLFLGGLVAGGAVGGVLDRANNVAVPPALGVGRYVAAGLLVGLGTRLGGGCTSGHGICGLARLSKRSIVAVCTFMAAGVATATALAFSQPAASGAVSPLTLAPLAPREEALMPILVFGAGSAALALTAASGQKALQALTTGTVFGVGLSLGGMVHPQKVTRFLDVTGRSGPWDPSLACVMAGGLAMSTLSYGVMPLLRRPVMGDSFKVPSTRVVDARLVGGSALFGIGWGLGGMCPGPAITNLVLPLFKISIGGTAGAFCAAMAVGMALADALFPPKCAAPAATKQD